MDPARYLEMFLADARDHLAAAGKLTPSLAGAEADDLAVNELFRHLHSLKGVAAAMGFVSMTELAHAAEDLLAAIGAGATRADLNCQAVLLETLACLESMVDRAEQRLPPQHPEASRVIDALHAARGEPIRVEVSASTKKRWTAAVPPDETVWRIDLRLMKGSSFPAVSAAQVLGRLDKIGEILRSEPPLAALRTGRFDGRLSVLVNTTLSQRDLSSSIARMEDVESFDLRPGVAPRKRQEPPRPVNWVRVRADGLDAVMQGALDVMLYQNRVASKLSPETDRETHERVERCQVQVRRLHAELAKLRLIPFESVAHRLERTVHELNRDLGKRARLQITGREVRLDRSLVERLTDPLLHLVRNALDHGIEGPEERVEAGKPETGRVRIHLERDRATVRVVVEDDGRGLRTEELRRIAVARGFRSAEEASLLSDIEARMLVTLPGFSTAARSGQISGRGIGMDVVHSSVESMGGRLVLGGAPGRGLRVELHLPLSVSVIRSLLVRCGADRFAVPIATVRQTLFVDPRSVVTTHGKPLLRAGDRWVELVDLEKKLELPKKTAAPDLRYALVFPNRDRIVGLVVDEVMGRRDVMVKPLRAPLHAMREYAGAALLEDGHLALVLDPAYVTR